MKKRILAVLLSAAMCVGLLAGCGTGNKDTADDGQITLDVWDIWTDPSSSLTKAFETAVAEYEEEHPDINIELHGLDSDAYKTKMSTEFAGKADGIDVFYYWAPGMIKKLIDADKVLPIDEYVTDDQLARVKEGSTQSFEFDGKLYGLPIDSYMVILFCNQELFDEAGAKIPTTYDELLDAAKKLQKLDGVTPLALGAKDGWLAGFLYESLAMREVGAEKVNQVLLGKEAFDDEGFVSAAEKMNELYTAGVLGESPLEDGEAEANVKFLGGRAAMRLTGSWFASDIDSSEDSNVKDHIAVTTFPLTKEDGAVTDYGGGSNSSFFVNKSTDHPKEAAEFAAYICEAMGSQALELGSGFTAWNVETDESKISPTFVKMMDLFENVETGVLAWDTILDSNPAAIHQEACQTLLADPADVDGFIAEHQDVIGKQ